MRAINIIGLVAVQAVGLAGCGGAAMDASIGGTLTGLASASTVVLQDNGAANLSLTANGSFEFATFLPTDASYTVTVLTQPVGQTCTVANASGTVDATDNVTDVAVTCVTSASLVGTVSGLAAGTSVTLGDAGVLLPIASNGAFAFPGVLPDGTAYSVTVTVPPVGETCTVTNGQGTVPASGIAASISIACS